MPTPREDLTGYLESYPREMAFEDDPVAVLDRYHTPNYTCYNDGARLDRAALLAHVQPIRRRGITSVRVEVQDAMVQGDQAAARYTLIAETRKGRTLTTEVYLFGRLAPDGRLTRVDQITRIL